MGAALLVPRRIGVIGLGAIGGAVAARLAMSRTLGEELHLAAGSEAGAARLRESGLVVEGDGPPLVAPPRVFEEPGAAPRMIKLARVPLGAQLAMPRGGPYQVLLLCVRGEATAAALAQCVPLLDPDGAIVCLQNGLPEENTAAQAGSERTLGAVIGWSATVESPGRYRLTGAGGLRLGAFAPEGRPRLEACRSVLARAFPTSVTQNLAGARWGKLALNCAISTLGAVSGLSFGELAAHPRGPDLALRCIGEVVAVARALGVRLEPVSGLRAEWLDGSGRPLWMSLRRMLFRLAARQRPTQRSGMLERLLAGRTSGQIDDLNGAVVRAAGRVGVSVPLNRALLETVHAIERGERRVEVTLLDALWETR